MTSYKDLGHSSYSSYLQSSKWKNTKKKLFKSKLVKRVDSIAVCSVCESSNKLNVHHRTYKNLGNEKMRDLVVLCELCHEKAHDIEKYTNHSLYNSHKKIKKIFKENVGSGKKYAKERRKFLKEKSKMNKKTFAY